MKVLIYLFIFYITIINGQRLYNDTCRLISREKLQYCSPYLVSTQYVISNFNETEQDLLAYKDTQITGQCPYFNSLEYQCHKYFPHCIENDHVHQVQIEVMCEIDCFYNFKDICLQLGENYFNTLCKFLYL